MKGKFLGDTKGNRDLNTNRTKGGGGSGESHRGGAGLGGKFAGGTKGNRDLPPERSSGVTSARHKAGGSNAGKSGY